MSVTITDNQSRNDISYAYARIGRTPNTPTITGPLTVKPEVFVNYTIVTTDPDGDDIYYEVYYEDNWAEIPVSYDYIIGPYKSGVNATTEVLFSGKGIHTLEVRAIDIAGLKSEWGTLDIKVPTISSFNPLFLKLLEWFTHRFPILRCLIRFT